MRATDPHAQGALFFALRFLVLSFLACFVLPTVKSEIQAVFTYWDQNEPELPAGDVFEEKYLNWIKVMLTPEKRCEAEKAFRKQHYQILTAFEVGSLILEGATGGSDLNDTFIQIAGAMAHYSTLTGVLGSARESACLSGVDVEGTAQQQLRQQQHAFLWQHHQHIPIESEEEETLFSGDFPTLSQVLVAEGLRRVKLNLPESSIEIMERALDADPNDADALLNLAILLSAKGRDGEVLQLVESALRQRPWCPRVLSFAASFFRSRGHFRRLEKAAENALAQGPPTGPHLELVQRMMMETAAWENMSGVMHKIYLRMMQGQRVDPAVLLNSCASARSLSKGARLYAPYLNFQTEGMKQPFQPGGGIGGHRKGKIRIGFFSSSIRSSRVGVSVWDFLSHFNRTHAELLLFSYERPHFSPNHIGLDALTPAMRSQFDEIYDVSSLVDVDAVLKIRSVAPDVLIDVDGLLGEPQRSAILAARVSPVQIGWFRYPITMGRAVRSDQQGEGGGGKASGASRYGTPLLDYIIADRGVIPEDLDREYDEKIIRLKSGYFPSGALIAQVAVSPEDRATRRASFGLPEPTEDSIVLAAFGPPNRITPDVVKVWAQVLQRLPNSVLWLSDYNPVASRNILDAFASLDVPASRILKAPVTSGPQHLARYKEVDLFLDTWPFNQCQEAHDAIGMGVPVLTVELSSPVSRCTAALLRRMQLGELVSSDGTRYAALAVRLALDPKVRAQAHDVLTIARQQTGYFSGERLSRDFLRAIDRTVQTASAGLPPSAFEI
uniref:O-GlcNAc transferase C-terminal domain-containing protein n=1 Tax=Chromera velia CCMP2878 TaxID=1169474 RepID=A0A0G4GS62_9ALVE|eukprot:Cvel_23142.t1-p1 / transcript=Cvel_23142.t1 / gene=Cvel_23142 / organism=Chromera_velia_CCMP2878 / gene_product=Probable UDP-N-acetylglucosamine--peptide, putative / transcript_product=Probable UDP-N-acetylglucosamine--peptide, putative / location=Cvel_scaffold2353:900-4498(-) / protein_length=780 / sequence_SO=supercontig / SO=protein_coding / is_pseudo=false